MRPCALDESTLSNRRVKSATTLLSMTLIFLHALDFPLPGSVASTCLSRHLVFGCPLYLFKPAVDTSISKYPEEGPGCPSHLVAVPSTSMSHRHHGRVPNTASIVVFWNIHQLTLSPLHYISYQLRAGENHMFNFSSPVVWLTMVLYNDGSTCSR